MADAIINIAIALLVITACKVIPRFIRLLLHPELARCPGDELRSYHGSNL